MMAFAKLAITAFAGRNVMKTWELCGKTLEFIEETHTYLVDGIVVPSVTELISDPHLKRQRNGETQSMKLLNGL